MIFFVDEWIRYCYDCFYSNYCRNDTECAYSARRKIRNWCYQRLPHCCGRRYWTGPTRKSVVVVIRNLYWLLLALVRLLVLLRPCGRCCSAHGNVAVALAQLFVVLVALLQLLFLLPLRWLSCQWVRGLIHSMLLYYSTRVAQFCSVCIHSLHFFFLATRVCVDHTSTGTVRRVPVTNVRAITNPAPFTWQVKRGKGKGRSGKAFVHSHQRAEQEGPARKPPLSGNQSENSKPIRRGAYCSTHEYLFANTTAVFLARTGVNTGTSPRMTRAYGTLLYVHLKVLIDFLRNR